MPDDGKQKSESEKTESSLLEAMRKMLKNELKSTESNLRKEIKASEERLNERLNAIDNKITQLSERVNTNEVDIGRLKAAVKSIPEVKRDAISSHIRHYELLINGIEWKKDENLPAIFRCISTKLGFATAPPVRLIRFKPSRKEGIEPSRRPIKILFANLPDKHNFMESVKRIGKNLQVNCIAGFEELNTRLYVQDCLDSETYKLKNAALDLKRNRKLTEVSVINLQLYVRVNKDSRLIWVADKEVLDALAK